MSEIAKHRVAVRFPCVGLGPGHPRRPSRRVTACLSVAVALGAVVLFAWPVAAGSSGTIYSSSGGGLAVAIKKLEAAKTGRVTTREVLSTSDGRSFTAFEVSGSFDAVHRRFAASGTQGPNRSPFGVAVDASRGAPAHAVVYTRGALSGVPNFRALLPASLRSRPWLKFDYSKLLTKPRPLLPLTVLNTLLNLVPAGRPYAWLAPLGRPAKRGGTESIDRVETAHYQETVDFSAENELPNYLQPVVNTTGGTMKADVWIDHTSTVRRVRLTSRPTQLGGTNVTITITTDFSHLGSKLRIPMPAADQVADIATYANRK